MSNASASPHMSHLSHNGSAPNSPSSAPVQGNPQQQQSGYQPSTGYPSPAHYSYGAQGSGGEQYRTSPTGSNGSMPLPSMRSIDPNHAQQAHQAQQMSSSHLAGPSPYYSNVLPPPATSHYPNVTSDPSNRYAVPQDTRIISGGRNKKEIKRRTKSGCLTCRKRRIKCDEAKPGCRNCQKSKRDCMGYDPIFKQNPGPTAIQPALSAASPPSHPYGSQPSMYAPGASMAYEQQNAPGSLNQSQGQQQPQYPEYSGVSAIDPSLETLAPPSSAQRDKAHLQKETDANQCTANNAELPHLRAQPISIPEILDALGPAGDSLPLKHGGTQDPTALDEVKHLYHSIYSPGLENFLETKYFPIKGIGRLLSDKPLLEQFLVLIQNFAKIASADLDGLRKVAVLEARLVWALSQMVRAAAAEASNSAAKNDGPAHPAPEDPIEAAHRLSVFENLLAFSFAESNPLYKPNAEAVEYHKAREFEFWYQLGTFVTIKDSDPEGPRRIDEALHNMRNLLDGRENRDVLYSIAVVRAIGNRVADLNEQEIPHHLDEADDRNKLFVAKKFIRDESQGNGTTNVIRRLCDMVLKSWTPPTPVTTAP